MDTLSIQPTVPTQIVELKQAPAPPKRGSEAELREKFTQFVGETFYGQMLKSMRATVGKPAYFHGGRGEEVFQGQFDQRLAEELTKSSAKQFAEPMFERQFPQFSNSATQAGLSELTSLRRI